MGIIFLRGEKFPIETASPVDLVLPEWNIIIRDTLIGEGVSIWSNLNIYGAKIGANTKLSSFVEIRTGVEIGPDCKIEPFAFIPEGVKVGRCVFIGPHVVFTNDVWPSACDDHGSLKKEYDIIPTMVEDHASIGAGSIIRCGVTVSRRAMVGAGSVIVNDIGENEVYYGGKAVRRRQRS